MRRALPWIGVAGAALVTLMTLGTVLIAAGAQRDASAALSSAQRLYDARVAVAEAQEALGDAKLEEGIAAARKANAIALRVQRLTERIVAVLGPTKRVTQRTVASARRGAQGATVARRQTRVATDILGAVDGYQKAATRHARATNGALTRILRALIKTNEQFSPGGIPGLP